MGPQIPMNLLGDYSMDVRTDVILEDPLEFTSSYLTLYGLLLAQDFLYPRKCYLRSPSPHHRS